MAKRWNEEEIKILKEEYHFADINKLSEKIGRKVSCIQQMAFKLGLKRGQLTNKRKLKHDISWLKKNYGIYSNRTLAIYLGTSVKYVKKLGIKYGLSKSGQYYAECLEHRKANHYRYVKAWRERNPDKVKEHNRRYIEKKKYESDKAKG